MTKYIEKILVPFLMISFVFFFNACYTFHSEKKEKNEEILQSYHIENDSIEVENWDKMEQ